MQSVLSRAKISISAYSWTHTWTLHAVTVTVTIAGRVTVTVKVTVYGLGLNKDAGALAPGLRAATAGTRLHIGGSAVLNESNPCDCRALLRLPQSLPWQAHEHALAHKDKSKVASRGQSGRLEHAWYLARSQMAGSSAYAMPPCSRTRSQCSGIAGCLYA